MWRNGEKKLAFMYVDLVYNVHMKTKIDLLWDCRDISADKYFLMAKAHNWIFYNFKLDEALKLVYK